jgi:hypothetical protein
MESAFAELSLGTLILMGNIALLLITIRVLYFLIGEARKFFRKMKKWK